MAATTRYYSVVSTCPWIAQGAPTEDIFSFTFDDGTPGEYPTYAMIETEAKRRASFPNSTATHTDALPAELETDDISIKFVLPLELLAPSLFVGTGYTWAP